MKKKKKEKRKLSGKKKAKPPRQTTHFHTHAEKSIAQGHGGLPEDVIIVGLVCLQLNLSNQGKSS